MNSVSRSFLIVLVCLVSRGFGQAAAASPQAAVSGAAPSAAAKVEMPSDPAVLLALAAKENGVGQVAISPWHMKATYQVLNDHGAVRETGTIEEIWVSPKVYKLSYAGPGFKQTDYSTEAGLFRTGSEQWPDYALDAARDSLFPRIPSGNWIKTQKLTTTLKTVGGDQLKCVAIGSPDSPVIANALIYCFNSFTVNLRVSYTGYGSHETFYNNTARFGGAYVARDVSVKLAGKPFVHVHLDLLEYLPMTDRNLFAAPPGSVAVTRRISFSPGVAGGKILSTVAPEFPEEARITREQGPVVLQTIIGTNGKVLDVKAIAGPQLLRSSAENAVRRWTFEPYRMGGEAVEGQDEITVTFWGGGTFVPFG
jgi:hypothetical protein